MFPPQFPYQTHVAPQYTHSTPTYSPQDQVWQHTPQVTSVNPNMPVFSGSGACLPVPPVEQFSSMCVSAQSLPHSGSPASQQPPGDNYFHQHSYHSHSQQPNLPAHQYMANQPIYPPIPPLPPGLHHQSAPPQHLTQPTQYAKNYTCTTGSQQSAFGPPRYSNGTQSSLSDSIRVSSERIPSAVEVIESNRVRYSGPFCTGQRSVVPPLVTTDFVCRDEGNCNPRFVRSSLYAVPITSDLIKTVGVPFTITTSPFATLHAEDQPIILSNMGDEGPVRCVRCRAYINPFVGFVDGGRRFQCVLCNAVTYVRESYFAHLDHTGRRTDVYYRPELCRGSYEMTTTVEYCKNNQLPNPPAFIFLLDVSQASVRSGLVNLFCSQFADRILPKLPKDSNDAESTTCKVKVGFITYDHQIHFYNLLRETVGSANATQNGSVSGEPLNYAEPSEYSRPQMHVVADVEDVFVPAVEGFLVSPNHVSPIENLLHLIRAQFCSDPVALAPDAALGPAIQAGLEALRAANCPGKLFVFHSNLPTSDGPGKLKNREDRSLIGTDKEKTLLSPAGGFYTGLGQACVDAGCSVDLFLFPNAFADIATLSEVPRLTAGHIFKYNCFQADLQGAQFLWDLEQAVARPKAFNAVMRVRCSSGIRPVEFFGNFHMPNTNDVELACVDPDTAVTVQMGYDDKLQDKDVTFIQVACLYTSLSGQRRLRIHNLSLTTSSCVPDVFRLVDLDAHMNWLFKFALRSLYGRAHAHVVEDLTSRTAHTLATYRRHCGSADLNRLFLPELMKLFPLYVHCLMKSDAFMPADEISIDERAWLMFLVSGMDVKQTNMYLYPRLYPVHNLNVNFEGQLFYPPPAIRCSVEWLQPDGAYLLDNGVNLLLWLGPNVPEEWIQNVLVGSSVAKFEAERIYYLPLLDNEASRGVRYIISKIHDDHSRHSRLLVFRSGDKRDVYFRRFLVEDRYGGKTGTYFDYLRHIHKEINLLR